MAYGVSYPDLYFRSASLIDKIFRGAKPGDLPVEQPTKLEFIVNLKAAERTRPHGAAAADRPRRRGDRMRRREFIGLLGGGAAAWPLVAWAQQSGGMKRVGVLMGYAESDREGQVRIAAFREGLQKLGWAEGRNLRIDPRWATAGDAEAHRRSVKELVALQPDLILSHNTPTTAALLRETRTIAIVFASVSDPVGSGFVASFPRPGGNVTGFTNIEPTMAGKSLELLKEIAPTRQAGCAPVQPGNGAIYGSFP